MHVQHILDTAPINIPVPDELHSRIPARVNADGNGLPRSGSVMAFGTEKHF